MFDELERKIRHGELDYKKCVAIGAGGTFLACTLLPGILLAGLVSVGAWIAGVKLSEK